MRQIIVRLGLVKAVVAITAVSVSFSVLFTLMLILLLKPASAGVDIIVATLLSAAVPLVLASGASWIMVGLVLKIHKLEEEMRALATYDSLTGLLNRRAFMEQADCFSRLAERKGSGFSMLVVDLDHFKKINDRYGHANGDRVLEAFGKTVRQAARKSDVVGRIGGEEFAFYLPEATADDARVLAERLHRCIRETTVEMQGAGVRYSVSMGLACFPRAVNVGEALNLADRALYRAKNNGRNQTAVYSPASDR